MYHIQPFMRSNHHQDLFIVMNQTAGMLLYTRITAEQTLENVQMLLLREGWLVTDGKQKSAKILRRVRKV